MEAAQSRKYGFCEPRANECRIKGVPSTGMHAISEIAIHSDTPVNPDQRNLQPTTFCERFVSRSVPHLLANYDENSINVIWLVKLIGKIK